MEPVADSTLTLEEANKLAAAIDSISDSTKYTTNKYYIVGTVKNIANPTYGNPTIVDEDGNEFYSYGMYDTDGETKYEKLEYKPVKGDVVTLYGTIGIYVKNGVASNQMNNGILTNVVPHNHDWSHEATCDNPATCNICGGENVIAHTPSENELTCSTPIYCTVCREILETEEHVDENENCRCDVCKANLDTDGTEGKEIVFNLGENGKAEHVDGSVYSGTKTYTANGYTLSITDMADVYGPAYDAMGNSCIKLGTGKRVGSFKFTVPDDVTSVVIYIAQYKANATKINVNNTSHTITTASNNGEYTAITVDTTTTKTVSFTTVSGGLRAMIDSIIFVVPGEIKSHEHNVATKEENRVESTCTVAGHYDLVTYCSDEDCGEEISRTRVELELADHSYVSVETKPTCTEDGYTTYTCSVCGHSYEDDYVDALGHKEVAHDAKAATCTEAGHKAYVTCERCNYTTYEEVAKLGHDLVDVAEKKATCIEAGYSAHKDCSRCDYIEGKEDYAVLDHAWNDATCEAPKTCGTCGATEGEANGHTVVVDEAVAPTCTATGLTEGSHCSVCGKVLKAQTVVEKLDHTPGEAVKEDVVESTCTSEGNYELAVYCSVCKKALSRDYITTPVAEHAKVQHEAKAATCTEIGWNAYETCKNCSYTTYVELPALDHIDEDNNNVCDREDCKAALCQDGDHVEGEGEVTTPATCVATGTRTFKCTACGEILRTEEIAIDENAHNMVKMPGKQKTCTEDGYSTYYLCTLCGLEEDKDVLKAEGHLVNVKVNPVEPTCTEPGKTRGVSCTYCDYEEISKEIPALGHDMTVAVNGQEATCTVDGYTAHTKCSRCDYTEGKVVIPAGHNYTSVVTDPTCTEDGYTTYTCSDCGDSYNETGVGKLGHDIVTDAAVDATCTSTGLTAGSHCSRCDDMTVAQETVPALGHDMVPVEGKPATCTEPGYTAYTDCSRCDHIEGKETIDALDHEILNHDAKAPTCTEKGWNAYVTCSRCDYSTYEEIGTIAHKYENDGKHCDVCGYRESEEGVDVTFALGANGTASHNDGSSKASYTETANGYTLDITNGTNMYTGARDATGNSCIKLGTSSKAGSFTFTVPDNVTSVVIHVAAYKAKTATVNINGTTTVLTTKSDNGQYDAITVDTSVEKTVSLTVSSGYRAMVNSIEFVSCGHEWKTEVTNATCSTDGSITDTCTKCEVVEETIIKAIGHDWGEGWVETITPTETTDGEESRTCNNCGTTETNVIPSLAHQHNFVPTVTDPTCTEQGYTTYNCACGEDSYEADYVDALGHNWDDGVVTDPTCTEDGYTTYTCGRCKTTETREEDTVDALGHKDEDGDFECDHDCGTIVEPEAESILTIEQAEILANLFAHNTYTTNKYYITCEIEKVYDTQYGNINIVGSKFVIYGLYSADGKTRYDAMTYKPVAGDEITVYGVIGKYNTTLQMKNGWLDEVVVHEHNYTSVVTDPTCTEGGYTTHTCSICNDSYTDSETEALGHTTDNGTCERCGNTIGGDAPAEPVTVTFTTNAQGYTNGQEITNITIDTVISGTFNKGSNSNASKYYNTGTAIRMYGGNTLTISSASGYVIDSIVITTQSSNKFNSGTTVNGTTITISGTTVTMSDLNTSSVVIKNGGTSGHARILTITVTYKAQ